MRIRRLDLDLFGHFTGKSYDFEQPAGGADFHVIYGRNEAGKTTTMEGFLRLLYGFPGRDPYDFQHQRKNLRVSGVLDIDGAARRFTRLPKRSGALLDGHGTPLPESALTAHLGGLGVADYRALLCLDDATIEEGGQEIANAKGDIGKLLFSAAAGISDLSGVLDLVRDRADEIYRKRAQSTRIAGLKKELSEVERRIREQDVSAAAWGKLKQALQQARTDEAAVRAARDSLRAQAAAVAARQTALPLLGDMNALAPRLAASAGFPARLPITPEDLVPRLTAQSTAQSDATRLREEIAALDAQLDATPLDPAHLGLSDALDALEDLRSRDVTGRLDLDRRKLAYADVVQDMARDLRDLGVPEGTEPDALVLSKPQMAALEAARDAVEAAVQAQEVEAQESAALRTRCAAAEDSLAQAAPVVSPEHDAGAVLARFAADTLAPARATAVTEVTTAELALKEALAALSVAGQRVDTLPPCVLTVAQAEDWVSQHANLLQRIAQAQDSAATYHEEAQVQAEKVTHLARAGDLLSDAQAAEGKALRDALWAAHLEALDQASAAAFASAMVKVDKTADQRLSQARALGQLRQAEQAIVEAQTRAAQAEGRLKAEQAALAALEAQLAEAARACWLPTPLSAPEMLAWVRAHHNAQRAEARVGQLRQTHGDTLAKARKVQAALLPMLALEDPDFDTTLDAARRLAQAQARDREARRAAEQHLTALTGDLAKRTEKLTRLTQEAARARSAFEALVAAQFGGVVDPAILALSLTPLRNLREQEAARNGAARQVAGIERDQARFAVEVRALAQAQGLAEEQAPQDSFAALRARADAAHAAQDRRTALTAQRAAKTESLQAAQQVLDKIDAEVREISALFADDVPKASLADLREAVAQGQEAIADRAQHAALVQRVLVALSVPDIDAAHAQMDGATTADLAAEAQTLATDAPQAEDRLTQATERRVAAEKDLSAVTGDAEVATLVERRATLALQIEEAALVYLELSFGHRLAEEAIRRYRDAHRSGMMQATEQSFAALTNGAYGQLRADPDGGAEVLVAVDAQGVAKQVGDMSKGTRFQLYLALRAAAYAQLSAQGIRLPFFCDDVFETFDEDRTRAACQVMAQIGQTGQAIYLTHHRHVVDIAQEVCGTDVRVHTIE